MNFFLDTLKTLFLGDACSKKKTRTEFERAVYLESISVVKEYLNDPEFDATYDNGIILTDAVLAGRNKSALVLAQEARLSHVLVKQGLYLAVLFNLCWDVFQLLLRNQPDSERLLKVATRYYCQHFLNGVYKPSICGNETNFIYINILNLSYKRRLAQKSLYQLINTDAVALCLGLLPLGLPDLLVTFVLQNLCEPWCNNVEFHLLYNCSRLTSFFSKHLHMCKLIDHPILTARANVLIGLSARFYPVPERFKAFSPSQPLAGN